MPRTPRPWFRFYVEAIWDRKLRRLPPGQRWLWVVVLAIARQSVVPGVLLVSEDQAVEVEDLVDTAALRAAEVDAGLAAFVDADMLHFDTEWNAWRVTKWADRQFESDDVNERSRRSRSKRDSSPPEPTPLQRGNDVASNGASNVAAFPVATPPETETDSETELQPPNPHDVGAQGRRDAGENPRAIGTNPRAVGTNQRALDVDAFLGGDLHTATRRSSTPHLDELPTQRGGRSDGAELVPVGDLLARIRNDLGGIE